MTVATIDMGRVAPANASSVDGNAFQTLATFLFGENSRREAMAMTTPVITRSLRLRPPTHPPSPSTIPMSPCVCPYMRPYMRPYMFLTTVRAQTCPYVSRYMCA
jgi:hypothetical protein